jgi:hypothetical protein
MNRVLAAAAALSLLLLGGCGSSTRTKTAADAGASTTTTTAPATTTTTAAAATTTVTAPATTRPSGTTVTTPASRGTVTTATTQAPARGGTVQVGDKDNGMTVRVRIGSTVVVVLNSTYWGFASPSNGAVVRQVGGVTTVPAPIGTCVVGGGCGTVSATYQAVAVGQSEISASRTTCGEALQCTGGAGSYSLQVVVTSS